MIQRAPLALLWAITAILTLHPLAVAADQHRDVLIDAPEALALLSTHPLDLGTVVWGKYAANNADLALLPGWGDVVAQVDAAVQAHRKADKRAGVGMRYSHRLFDRSWLVNPQAHMELVAVVNRLDRVDFGAEGCGELRLIYRLGYALKNDASRLPMTINVVLRQPGTCFEAWKRWPWDASRHPDGLVLPGGALDPALVGPHHLVSVELNVQVLRWPSTVQPDLGGHAAYAMRVLRPDGTGRLRPSVLENQLDIGKISGDPALKAQLIAWLTDPAHLRAIDQGVAVLPDVFLTTAAESVAPRGLARLENRPFRRVLAPTDLAAADLTPFAQMKTTSALLRRLDGMSCTGCHQSNSLAGFHLLGAAPPAVRVDALHVGRSAHLQHEVAARQEDMDRWPEVSPPRRRDAPDLLNAGMPEGPCDLGQTGLPACLDLPTQPLRCVQLDDPELGVCLGMSVQVGDACEAGALRTGVTSVQDSIRPKRALPCPGSGFCESSRAGFPAGMCADSCSNPPDGTTCTGIPRLVPFNACLAKGRPFVTCVVENAAPKLVRSCGPDLPCRPDYVCSRGPAGQGACLPPYFLRQLRVDGHPPLR